MQIYFYSRNRAQLFAPGYLQECYKNQLIIRVKVSSKTEIFNMSRTIQMGLKKVKIYLLGGGDQWKEVLTGYLSISERQDKNILKVVIQSQIKQQNELQPPIYYLQDEEGKNVIIPEQKIETMEKPEEQIIYMQLSQSQETVSLSFSDRNYCDLVWDQLTLLRENINDEKTWTRDSVSFLLAELKTNIAYVDFLFASREKIKEFCELFQALKNESSPIIDSFFSIIRIVFLRGQADIMKLLFDSQFFETILDILSLNPFNDQAYSYWQKYLEMTKIKNYLDIEDTIILNAYNCNTRVKFIKDCAICMFTEPMTDLALSNIVSQNNVVIIQRFIDDPINMQILEGLSIRDPKAFLVTFTQLIQILKSLPEDYQTKSLKDSLYHLVMKAKLNSLSIKVAQQITGQDVSARVFQKWLEVIYYLANYNWNQAQQWLIEIVPESTFDTPSQNVWDYSVKNILKPANAPPSKEKSDKPISKFFDKESESQQKYHLMKTLTAIMKEKQFSIKHSVLQFTRQLIEPTDFHNHVSTRLKWFVFQRFIINCFEICNTKEHLQMYLDFIVDVYEIEPIRTRKVLVQCDVLPKISSMLNSKYVFIMVLKLLKIMIQKEDEDTFVYLINKRVFHDIKKYYIKSRNSKNILNSTFLSVLKTAQKCQKQATRKYIAKIFFPQEEDNFTDKISSSQLILASQLNTQEIVVQIPLKVKTRMLIQSDEQVSSKERIMQPIGSNQEIKQVS